MSFIELLDRIRTGSVDDGDVRSLNERVGPGEASAICLTTTRKAADRINGHKLDRLGGEPATSLAEIHGDFPKVYYPTETELTFKVGARIMMLNNDPAGRWVNGSIGDIKSVGRNGRWVRILLHERDEQTSDEIVDVEPYTWESVRFALKDGAIATEKTGSFRQLPFRLAWAVTIHKSQGKTFKNITVDLVAARSRRARPTWRSAGALRSRASRSDAPLTSTRSSRTGASRSSSTRVETGRPEARKEPTRGCGVCRYRRPASAASRALARRCGVVHHGSLRSSEEGR